MTNDQVDPTTSEPDLPGDQPADQPVKKAAAKRAPAKKATAKKASTKKTAAKKTAPPAEATSDPAAEPAAAPTTSDTGEAAAYAPAAKAPARKRTTKKVAAETPAVAPPVVADTPERPTVEGPEATDAPEQPAPVAKAPAKKAAAKKTTRKSTAKKAAGGRDDDSAPAAPPVLALRFQAPDVPSEDGGEPPVKKAPARKRTAKKAAPASAVVEADEADVVDGEGVDAVSQAAETSAETPAQTAAGTPAQTAAETGGDTVEDPADDTAETEDEDGEGGESGDGQGARRRRRRGGRRRRKSGDGPDAGDDTDADEASGDPAGTATGEQSDDATSGEDKSRDAAQGEDSGEQSESTGSRRRRRRRRGGEGGDGEAEEQGSGGGQQRARRTRGTGTGAEDITALAGSTRLEAKKQRRREGREAGRRRAPIVSEAEFLSRRESVERIMVIRQRDDLTQIGVLEDKVLVEHYVARESQTSLIGNVYLGRVQNVLPSMEAAFVDIGKGRNAVLYAGEVNWSTLGHRDGQPRKIESVLSSGQPILVQVTKDPVGHKGARLTSQVSLAGRFLVYVPDGTTSGISRKLPDTERGRLKSLLKEIVPETAGVIVRTAAEGASEDELTRDVERLKARWDDIESKLKGSAPQLLYGEPDLTLKVVRDLFTEDFAKLVIQGEDAWDTVQGYVSALAPDLEERLERYDGQGDAFTTYRVDEQIAKGLDRKVWLPSGGSLVIDRTEAMTVVDVNTGKFTGSGGNLEETVTKNNLEAAEEIVRQLRLRDIGGIIVVDFIDMVLEDNRDLVLRRLVECLGRDRTRHQVAEVTSLGLVQMTRKRIGTGLLEAFSENCEHCGGRGLMLHDMPVAPKGGEDDSRRGGGGAGTGNGGGGGNAGRRSRGGRGGRGGEQDRPEPVTPPRAPTPAEFAAMARHEQHTGASSDSPGAQDDAADGQHSAAEPVGVEVLPPVVESEDVRTPAPSPEPQLTVAPTESVAPADPIQPPAAPKVVTRTRRAASRPVGSPEPISAQPVAEPAEPVADPAEPVADPAAEASTATVVEATEPAGPLTPPEAVEAPVEAPRVVTRTRGRAASRPSGPPSTETPAAEPMAYAAVTEPVADAGALAEPEPPVVTHVPLKKRGGRRR